MLNKSHASDRPGLDLRLSACSGFSSTSPNELWFNSLTCTKRHKIVRFSRSFHSQKSDRHFIILFDFAGLCHVCFWCVLTCFWESKLLAIWRIQVASVILRSEELFPAEKIDRRNNNKQTAINSAVCVSALAKLSNNERRVERLFRTEEYLTWHCTRRLRASSVSRSEIAHRI